MRLINIRQVELAHAANTAVRAGQQSGARKQLTYQIHIWQSNFLRLGGV